jgi:hypothetical protein
MVMDISSILRRCDDAGKALNARQGKRGPQYHLWVAGDELPHQTAEQQEKFFLPTDVSLDPNRDIVMHWPKKECRTWHR